MGFDDGFGDREAHAGAFDAESLVSAAVEFFEDEALFRVVDAVATVGDANHQEIAAGFGRDSDGFGRGRVLVRVFEEMDEDFRGAGEVHADAREAGGEVHTDDAIPEGSLGLILRGGNHFIDRMRCKIQFHFAGIQLSHLGGFADQAIQAIAFLVDDDEQLVLLAIVEATIGEQVRCRGFDGSERGAEGVGDGIEERGPQALTFSGGFGLTELFDGASALHRDGDKSAEGFKSLARKDGARDAQAADGTYAHADGNEANAVGSVNDRLLAGDNGLQAFEIEHWDYGAGAIDFLLIGEEKSGGTDFEGVNDLRGNAIEQLDHVAGFEQALAEGVQPFDFAAAGGGALSLMASASGEMA